ncbi:MAG: hypothetical protein Q9213_005158 [Squamulea squamosa]
MSFTSSPNISTIQEGCSTPTETSGTTPPSTPPPKVQRAFTVVNTMMALRKFLDTIVREMTIPPKMYSQAHIFPKVNSPYARTCSQSKALVHRVEAPSPLFNVPKSTPELYVDAEGISLSRSGELSILIIHVQTPSFSHTYLLHVHVLGRRTFTTRTANGLYTLKSILEDNRIPKVLFDCRMDSDALFGQFGVLLGGVIDLQLMCVAAQGGGPRYLPGLAKCLLLDLVIPREEQEWIAKVKEKGQRLWRPMFQGSMQRFNDNPLHDDIVNYCVVDAAYLPRLFETYNKPLENRVSLMAVDDLWKSERSSDTENRAADWVDRILERSRGRVQLSLMEHFMGGTAHNPWYEYDDDDW